MAVRMRSDVRLTASVSRVSGGRGGDVAVAQHGRGDRLIERRRVHESLVASVPHERRAPFVREFGGEGRIVEHDAATRRLLFGRTSSSQPYAPR